MKKKLVIQRHHISYDPEVTVDIFKGEHWILTNLLRRKNISEGFIIAIKSWILQNERFAQKVKK